MTQPESNPLRKELARSQQAGSHPDSDMLTAFAEGSLLARERESVLQHLALCVQCREVLSLATAASPEPVADVQPLPLPRHTRPRLRSWLPWVVAAAGVLIVSSALLLHEQKKPSIETGSARTGVAANEIAEAPEQLPPPSEPKTATASHKTPNSGARRETTSRRADNSTAAPASAAALPPVPSQEQRLQAVPAQAGAASSNDHRVFGSVVPRSKEFESPGSQAEGSSAILRQNQTNQDQMARAKAAPAPSQVMEVPGAMPAGSSTKSADAVSAPASSPTMRAAKAEPMRPHWRINNLGQLERAFGSGTWEPVPTGETSKLHVVSASGSEVWVGGENLRLEHSSDNGETWEAIQLPAKNGYNHAVTHIRFQTPQEGLIDSDDGTSWKTTDGGKIWR